MLHELATAKARIAALEENSRELISRLEAITARATSAARTRVRAVEIAAELGRKLQMQSQSSRGRL
jgi:hypothetical protein